MKNTWLFPLIEAIHLVGMAAFIGTLVLTDLRRIPKLTAWTNAGLAILLGTGLLLFSADTARYLHNPAFLFKMAVFAPAIVLHFTPRRSAILSLILWTLVIISARAVADFDL